MAQVFRGSVAGTAQSDTHDLPQVITNYSVSNKSGGSVTFSAYVNDGVSDILISPLNHSVDAGEMYEDVRDILMIPGDSIKIISSGAVDFYFSIQNVQIKS